MTPATRRILTSLTLTTLLLTGCHRKRKTRSAPKSEQFSEQLKPIVASRPSPGPAHGPTFLTTSPSSRPSTTTATSK